MRAQTSSNFSLIGPPTAELDALERLEKKTTKAYNGKNDVSTFSRPFLIRSFSYLQVMTLGQIGSKLWFPWQQKAPIGIYWRKRCLHFFSAVFHPILFILGGNDNLYENSIKFKFWPDWTTDWGVSCP